MQHDILDFSYCPFSCVLHVTLANWQRFGFEFHLRSSPSAYIYSDDCRNVRGLGKSMVVFNLICYKTKIFRAGVHLKAVLTWLNTAFLPISRSRFKQR